MTMMVERKKDAAVCRGFVKGESIGLRYMGRGYDIWAGATMYGKVKRV